MKKLKFKRAQKNSAAHIMIFILGMLLLILISGCGRRDGETRENHILRLLREKYGEEFEILEESDHYNPFDLACPVGQKDKTFEVEYTIFGMTDAYYCVLMRDEYADRIETAVCEVFHENKMNVSFRATVHPNDTYSNRHSAKFEGVSFDKALKIESPVIKGMVLIMVKDNGGNYSEQYNQVIAKINEYVGEQTVTLYFVSPEFYNWYGNERKEYSDFMNTTHEHGAVLREGILSEYDHEFVHFKHYYWNEKAEPEVISIINERQAEAVLLDDLREKYNEEFEVVSKENRDFSSIKMPANSSYRRSAYSVCPIGRKDQVFKVEVEFNSDTGVFTGIRDAYYNVLVRDEYAELIENAVRDIFPESKMQFVFRTDPLQSDEFIKGVFWEQARSMDLLVYNPLIETIIMVKDDGSYTDGDWRSLLAEIGDLEIGSSGMSKLSIYIVPEDFYDSHGNEQIGSVPQAGTAGIWNYVFGASLRKSELDIHKDEFVYAETKIEKEG